MFIEKCVELKAMIHIMPKRAHKSGNLINLPAASVV